MVTIKNLTLLLLGISVIFISCESTEKGEHLSVGDKQSSIDSLTVKQSVSSPNTTLLTGIDRIRLIPIYKISPAMDRNIDIYLGTTYDYYYYTNNEGDYKYFMPGLDIIYGYNMINMGHYDIETEKLSYLFDHPVLIRTFYFPGLKTDSLNHKPITRNYFLVSVYDEDTNHDSVIDTKDLRKFYYIDQFNSTKTQIIPSDYSAIRSTYDHKNDIMYIHARYDSNKNGTPEKKEPVAIFWIRLNDPTIVKKMI